MYKRGNGHVLEGCKDLSERKIEWINTLLDQMAAGEMYKELLNEDRNVTETGFGITARSRRIAMIPCMEVNVDKEAGGVVL